MIEITEQMRELVNRNHADGWTCTVESADKDGRP